MKVENAKSELGESLFAEIGHPKKRAFLAAYAETGIKTRAAAMAGIVKQTLYTRQWREDAEFQAALKLAKEMACQVLEDEAVRRAVETIGPGVSVRRHRSSAGCGVLTRLTPT